MNDVPDGLIQTFEQRFSNTNKILDLKLSNSPNLGADYTANNLMFKKYNKSIDINFNKSLIAFNNHYPLTDLNIFLFLFLEKSDDLILKYYFHTNEYPTDFFCNLI